MTPATRYYIIGFVVIFIVCEIVIIVILSPSEYMQNIFNQFTISNLIPTDYLSSPQPTITIIHNPLCNTEYLNEETFGNTRLLIWHRIPKTAGTNFLELLSKFTDYNYYKKSPHFSYAAYKGNAIKDNIHPIEVWSGYFPEPKLIEQNMKRIMDQEDKVIHNSSI